jgi:hypothetical protein
MKRLALACAAALAISIASDVSLARGSAVGYHGGAHGSGIARHGAERPGGSEMKRWHADWHGGALNLYLGQWAYPFVWPYAYYGTYPHYDPQPPYASSTTTVYVEPGPQAVSAYDWYYCADPRGYYPYVQDCNEAWLSVAPQR